MAYEVLPGNTADKTTLQEFLQKIEGQYGKAQRIWVMDRGIPTEAVLEQMRTSDPPVYYLVGTPKGRLNKLESQLLERDWQAVRPGEGLPGSAPLRLPRLRLLRAVGLPALPNGLPFPR